MVASVMPFNDEGIVAALRLLWAGAAVAFATDTVYGLGCDALDPYALESIYTIKGRPETKPLPILLAELKDLELVAADVPPIVAKLAAIGWPGPLTLVVPAADHLPQELTLGNRTVGVRIPNHAPLRELIRSLGSPLVGTSANLHGQPSATSASMARRQLGTRIQLILDGGPSASDSPSTIIDVCGPQPRILRQGALPLQAIAHLLA